MIWHTCLTIPDKGTRAGFMSHPHALMPLTKTDHAPLHFSWMKSFFEFHFNDKELFVHVPVSPMVNAVNGYSASCLIAMPIVRKYTTSVLLSLLHAEWICTYVPIHMYTVTWMQRHRHCCRRRSPSPERRRNPDARWHNWWAVALLTPWVCLKGMWLPSQPQPQPSQSCWN